MNDEAEYWKRKYANLLVQNLIDDLSQPVFDDRDFPRVIDVLKIQEPELIERMRVALRC